MAVDKIQEHLEEKIKEGITPWLLCASAMPVALVTHTAWGGDPAMNDIMAAGATALTFSTWATWSRRHEHTRVLATAIAGAVTGWTALAVATSPLDPGMLKAWMFGGTILSIMWNARHFAHKPAHESDKASGTRDGLMEKVGGAFSGARIRRTKTSPGRVEAEVELAPGETEAGAQGALGTLASVAGVGTSEVTVKGDPKRARKIHLTFQEMEELRKTIHWPGVSAPGTSVADSALRFGELRNGTELGLWVCGNDDRDNPRPAGHVLNTGVTRSGKTSTAKTLIVEGRSRIDFVPVVADPAKFMQGFGRIADTLAIAATTEAECRQLIRNIPDAVKYRSQRLGELGFDQWTPACWTQYDIPMVFIDLEEATDYADESELDAAIRKAGSVGILIMVSLQTAIHTNIERKTRGQLTNSLCHGCVEDFDAKFALSQGTLEAGADPTKWRNNFPGSLYAELVGTLPETWATEARAYSLTPDEMRAELDASRGTWAELDPGTALYLERGISVPDAKITATLPEVVPDEPEEEAVDMTKIKNEHGEVNVSLALTPPTGERFILRSADNLVQMKTEQARQLVEDRIDQLEDRGSTEVGFKDLEDLSELTGRRPRWIYDELHRLVAEGRLAEGNGRPPFTIRQTVVPINRHRREG
jgi:hypothetical protein